MKKLILIFSLLVIGCGSYANDTSVIVYKEINEGITKGTYKYRYKVYAEIHNINFYSNKEYEIGSKINFDVKEK